jgi:hypothetical protein
MCSGALRGCPPGEPGRIRLRVWQRLVAPPAEPTVWKIVGVTCAGDTQPASGPRLTMDLINEAAMRTPWATPVITIQPPHGVTLVNLPNFYQIHWSAGGYRPGQILTRTLLGVPVKIRPALAPAGFTYDFGDGQRLGPTASLGGVYPDGEVTHAYRSRGVFTTRVTTTWTAEFSLDDGRTWDRVTATATVPGPPTAVTVKEARAVLVR